MMACIFKFSKWRQCFLTKTTIMDISFELYNTRWLQDLEVSFSLCLQATWLRQLWGQLSDGSHVHAWVHRVMWSGELSDNYIAAVYVYCNTGRRNYRWCEIKNQAMRQQFSEYRQALIEFSEAWVATWRLDHCSLTWHGWWLATAKERKDFCPSLRYVETYEILGVITQSIVISLSTMYTL